MTESSQTWTESSQAFTAAVLLIFAALAASPANAQAGLGIPVVGRTVDAAGTLRDIHGIAGAFVLGEAKATEVLSFSCGVEMCLAKTASQVISDAAASEAPAGPAYFALAGTRAWVYFPSTRQLTRWEYGSLAPLSEPVEWPLKPIADGQVLGLGFDSAGGLIMAVRREEGEGVLIVDSGGSVLSFLSRASGPVLLLDGGAALYAAADRVFLKRADGSEIFFDLPDARAMFAMGEHWAGVRTGQANFAVRTERGREQVYELPESTR